jgi:uncharacterized cupredoxin-like copper-binding protein
MTPSDLTDDPVTDETATDETATDETATDETATDETATDETATDEPGTEDPATADHVVETPGAEAPEGAAYLRERILWPVVVPLAALVVIAFVALNLSRLLLAAEGGRAVTAATVVGILILVGATIATTRDRISRGSLLVLVALGGFAVTGIGLLANQVDRDHLAEADHGGGEPVKHLDVVAVDIDFPVKELLAPPGLIEFTYDNQGEIPHTFTFHGLENEFLLATAGGESASGTVTLEPGTYAFYCDVPGHEAAGMAGELTVEEGAPGSAAGGAIVEVPAEDITFPVTEFEAPAGPITFEYVNRGEALHTLVAEGFEEAMRVEAPGGETQQGSLTLEPGTYTLYCDIPGHRGQGMEGTLTVTENGGTGGGGESSGDATGDRGGG